MSEEKEIIPKSAWFKPAIFMKSRPNSWLIVFICMMTGALLGCLIGQFEKPLYQAEARVMVNLEIVRNANITEMMVDSQIDHISELAYHPDVINDLISLSQTRGKRVSLDYLKQNAGIERQLMTTVIKVCSEDAANAAQIATDWAEVLTNRIKEAYPHALLVSEAKAVLMAIEDCSSDPIKGELPFCQTLTLEDVNKIKKEANSVILKESPSAMGLTKDLNIVGFQPSGMPTRPIRNSTGLFILFGALAGLAVSIIICELRPQKEQ